MGRLPLRALALAGALTCAGCAEYLDRRDTLSLETGSAVQANIATQVIDPWPAKSRQINRDISGERLQRGIEQYRNPQAAAGAGAGQPFGSGGAQAPAGGAQLTR